MPTKLVDVTTPSEHAARYLWCRKHCLPPPAKTLDVGCGRFQLLEAVDGDAARNLIFHHDGHGCVGLEKNKAHIEEARRIRPQDQVFYCDVGVDRFPVEDDAFENVLVGEIIEHLPLEHWSHCLNECFRVTRHQILISTPGHHLNEDLVLPPNPSSGPDAHRFEPSWDTFKREIERVVGDRARRIEHELMIDFLVGDRAPDELLFNFILCRIYKREVSLV